MTQQKDKKQDRRWENHEHPLSLSLFVVNQTPSSKKPYKAEGKAARSRSWAAKFNDELAYINNKGGDKSIALGNLLAVAADAFNTLRAEHSANQWRGYLNTSQLEAIKLLTSELNQD